jgi:hypothetical protein
VRFEVHMAVNITIMIIWKTGTNVSEEPVASSFRVEELKMIAIKFMSSILKMEAAASSKTLIHIYQITLHHIPDNHN